MSTLFCIATNRDPVATASNVDHWGFWFPAMGVNVGAPAGNRNEHWLTGPNISGQPNAATTCQHSSYVCPDILRRDYANAIMLARPNIGVATDEEFNATDQPGSRATSPVPPRASEK
jgi:hypothetical protein